MDSKILQEMARNRLSRRRLLRAGGVFSVGGAALALVGCGSDGDSSDVVGGNGDVEPVGGIITSATGDPRRGGTFTRVTTGVANHSVVDNAQSGAYIYGVTVYDRPLTAKLTSDRYVLEAMEKIELVEPTKLVMTLKPDLVFQNKAPVSGRKVTGDDIKATQEYVKTNPTSYNATLQKGFLDRIEVSDDRTVTFHLSQPSAYLFTGFYLGEADQQRLEVVTTDGRTLSADVNPLNNTVDSSHTDEIIAKFRDSASWAVNRLDAAQVERIIEVVMDLEHVADVAVLAELTSTPPR